MHYESQVLGTIIENQPVIQPERVVPHAVTIERFARASGEGKHLIHAREKNKPRWSVPSAQSVSPIPMKLDTECTEDTERRA